MPRIIPIAALSKVIKREQNTTPMAIMGGERVEINSTEYHIQSAANILQTQDGVSPTQPGGSLNLAAFNILSTLGVTLSGETRTYSLLGDQTDTQTLDNISIFDPIYNTLTNTPVEARDKFSNNTDPFYELDDAPPSDETRRREKIIEDKLTPRMVELTTEIIVENRSNPFSPTLKQFVNNRDYSVEDY